MKKNFLKTILASLTMLISISCNSSYNDPTPADSMIIDHSCTNIFKIPVEYIEEAKQKLVIAYGHTSHGSQLVTGMENLDQFMTGHGYTEGLFNFSYDGENNSLALQDTPFDDAYDLGNPNFTEWYKSTREYLNNHSEVNVVMWSWCGEASYATTSEISLYLSQMNQLENDFPDVTFVYMTGHLDGSGVEGQLNVNNNQIRDYCRNNKKILYDFADIESYDPDGNVNYMELNANDNCDYNTTGGDSRNWALDWQSSHTENVDWYSCDPAHTQALNGNRKALAVWWLFARMAGWSPNATSASFNIKNENSFSWEMAENHLKIHFEKPQKIHKTEMYDLKGQLLFSENYNTTSSAIAIPVGQLNVSGKMAIFKIIADNTIYTGKFVIRNF